MVFSTTSSSRPDSSSSAFTTSVAAAAVATTVASLAMLIRWKIQQLKNKADQSPVVPGFPSPPGAHWLFGHLILLHHGEGEDDAGGGADFVRGYNAVYEKYADPQSGRGSFWFFTSPSISLLNGRDVKTILTASSYRDSIALFNVHNSNFLGRRALVALMGKEWRLYRSAVHKSFTPAVIRQSQTVICQVGETLVDSLIRETAATASTSGGTSPTPVLPLMKMATIDVFGKAALNVDFACCESLRLSPIAYAFDYLTVEYTRRMQKPWDPFSFLYGIPTKANLEHRRQRGLIRKFIADQISKTRQQIIADRNDGTERGDESSSSPRRSLSSTSTTGDLLSNLIKAADADSKDVSDDALGDIMMTLLFGGYDTTSITLTYALYLLAKHPDIEATCLEEIDAVIGKGTNGRATSSEITTSFDGPEQLPYTKAVILETLRLYPPAPVTSRTMEKEAVLQNPTATVQKGQNVMVPIWCIQRNEKNFPKPTEMHPERWVRRIKNAVHNNKGSVWEERPVDDFESNLIVPPANRDAFCVFAAGARNCVGRILAMQESVTLLALLVRRLKFKLVNDDYEVRPTICAVVQQPNDNLPMIITAR